MGGAGAARGELLAERTGQAAQDEAERLELLDRWLQLRLRAQPLDRPAPSCTTWRGASTAGPKRASTAERERAPNSPIVLKPKTRSRSRVGASAGSSLIGSGAR